MQTVEQVKKRIDYLLERDHATDAEIEEVYNQAIDTLRAIVSDVHNRYAVDGVVVPANLYGKVTVKDMLLLKQQYDKLPDDLSAPEQDRVDYYTAMSQTSPRGLITAVIGMALITVAHKASKIIQKNNRTAVKEEIAYQAKHENIPKMPVKKYASPEFKVKTGKDFIPWTERVLTDHDQAVNRISNVINSMVSQGMRAEDIANHFYPGNAESMRADNIPKIIRDATVKAKRTARTEAAAREDAIVEQTFKANNVKYFDWVTEPGACKVCTSWAISGPYKVGDESSPRIPGDSHPNCRCRRVGVYKSGPYDFIDLSDIDESKFKELERRLNNVIKVYKAETGIDIRQAIKDGTFSNKTLDREDVKTGFIDWLFHEVGYDAKPRVVKTFSAHEWFNKIAENPKDPNYLEKPTVFYRGIRANGDIGMDKIKFDLFKGDYIPSGTFTSDWGRGIYMTKHRQTTDRYTRGNGEVLELGLASDVKILVVDWNINNKITKLADDLGLPSRYYTDTHYDIVAVLSGYDIVKENRYAVELNVMNRGKIEWKGTNT